MSRSRFNITTLLWLAAAGLVNAPARAQAPHVSGRTLVTDRIIVKPRANSGRDALHAHIASLGAAVRFKAASFEPSTEKHLDELGMMVVKVAPGKHLETLNALAARTDVAMAAPVYRYEPQLTPNDPSFGSQYHHQLIGDTTAWDTTTGSSSMIIAMLDTGIDGTHPDLAPNLLPGWNFFDNNSDTSDVQGHGTATAGTAAAVGNNGIGVSGAAWNIKILPARISGPDGSAYSDNIAAAMKWAADQGAKVINCSFGPLQGDSVIENAANYARGKGSLVFVSSGNDGTRDGTPMSPDIIFVGATDANDQVVSWSTYGPAVKLCAPGNRIFTTQRGGGYAYYSGTSFSSPLAAGVAALVWSANPSLSNSVIEDVLRTTAKDIGTVGFDEHAGSGRIDAAAAMATVSDPAARMLSPAPSSTLSGTSATFQWSVGLGATNYVLWVGTAAKIDQYYSGSTTGQTATVTGLPADGRPIKAKLQSLVNGAWVGKDYDFTAVTIQTTPATLTSPVAGATLPGSAATFTWSAGVNAKEYVLVVRDADPTKPVYLSTSTGLNRSFTATGLPTDGRQLLVRVWTRFFDTNWLTASGQDGVQDTLVRAAGSSTPAPTPTPAPALTKAVLTTPAPGSSLTATSATFSWTAGSGAKEYSLVIRDSTSATVAPLVSVSAGLNTSLSISGLPADGRTLYIRLWTRFHDTDWNDALGAASVNDYTVMAFAAGPAAPGLVKANLTAPAPGSRLAGPSATFSWTAGLGAKEYCLVIRDASNSSAAPFVSVGAGLNTSVSVSGLPRDGRALLVRLWTRFHDNDWNDATGAASVIDYQLGAFNAGTATTLVKANLTAPTPGSRLTGTSAMFSWTASSGAKEYCIAIRDASNSSAAPIVSLSTGLNTSVSVSGLPSDGRALLVRLWTRFHDTDWNDAAGAPAVMDYSFSAFSAGPAALEKAQLTSPTAGSALAGAAATFVWTTVPAAKEFYIVIRDSTDTSRTPLLAVGTGLATSFLATGLPTDGRTLYVRLWTRVHDTDWNDAAGNPSFIDSQVKAFTVGP